VCASEMQCVAVCCSVLQRVAVCRRDVMLRLDGTAVQVSCSLLPSLAHSYPVLQSLALSCPASQCLAVRRGVVQSSAV